MPSSPAPTEPTTSGVDSRRAWLIVIATFASTFVGFGLVYSFGAFFDAMSDDFGIGRAATALMFSITTASYFFLGLVTGRIGDRVGPKPLLVTAAISLGLGMWLTSKVGSIELGYLTYGIGVGLAVACAYVPMVAFVGGWFVKHRTAALGIAVSGIGVGTLVMAPLAQALIAGQGWRRAFVILGIAGAAVLLLAALISRRPPREQHEEPAMTLGQLARDRAFVWMYVAGLLVSLALFVPFVFLKNYAVGEGISAGKAATLVGLVGAASVIGRLGLGSLGSRFSPLSLLRFSFATMSVSYLLWLFAGDSFVVLVLFAMVMGVGYGGYIALSPAAAAIIFGPVGLGQTLGFLYTSAGIGGLIGPPAVGAIIDNVSYDAGIITAMVLTVAATAAFFMITERRPAAADA